MGPARGRLADVHPRRSPGRRPAPGNVVTGERPQLRPALAARSRDAHRRPGGAGRPLARTRRHLRLPARPAAVAATDAQPRPPRRRPHRRAARGRVAGRHRSRRPVHGRACARGRRRRRRGRRDDGQPAARARRPRPRPGRPHRHRAGTAARRPRPADAPHRRRRVARRRDGVPVHPRVRAAGPRRRVDRRRAARRPPRRQPDRAPPAPRVPRPRRRPPPRSDPGRGRDRIHPERRRVGPGGAARRALARGTAVAAHRADRARLLRRPRDAARADARRGVLAGAGAPGRLGGRLRRRPPPGRRPPSGVTAPDDAGGRGVCVEPGPRPARG